MTPRAVTQHRLRHQRHAGENRRAVPSWAVPSWTVPSWAVPSWAVPSWVRALLVMLVLVGVGCGAAQVTLRPAPRSFTAKDYERVYETWTRSDNDFAFGILSDVLHVTATFQSWEFRWAYVVRFAEDHGLDTDVRRDMLEASLADAKEYHRFFVTLSGEHFRESDLTDEQTAWRVLLVDEAGRLTVPIEVQPVSDPTPAEMTYFPSVSPFRHAFRIVFPVTRPDGTQTIPAGADNVRLRFTGARGRVDLAWQFAK